ncbi:DUF2076 domain-containing protein [Massilia aerilata]|uniref:DUF2076 domain-containing protein n=1 Tax=Massilia aerilata TaxID=453817 RepID=A0ABW0S373_9BURK
MSPKDSQMLHDFLSQLIQARGLQKDPEADALIQRAVAQQPDAAYLLVQRSLLQEQALNNARDQIAQLQNQLQSAQQGDRRFLDANAWGNSGSSHPASAQMQQERREYQRDPRDYPPQQYQPQYQQPSMMGGMFGARSGGFLGGGGGLLGSIAATAAGVAAGNFLFHGLDNMFHHHDQGGGNRLLNGDDPGNNLFSDQSGSPLADQAGLGDIGGGSGNHLLDSGSGEVASEGLFDSGLDDSGTLDSTGGFFDGDGSDEGLFG